MVRLDSERGNIRSGAADGRRAPYTLDFKPDGANAIAERAFD
jgi:hypothetical protein